MFYKFRTRVHLNRYLVSNDYLIHQFLFEDFGKLPVIRFIVTFLSPLDDECKNHTTIYTIDGI